MKKRKKGRKLSKKKDQKKSLLKTVAHALFLREKIKTTGARAKEVLIFAEKQISRAKINDLSSRRVLARYFSSKMVKKLVNEIGPKYRKRKGGCVKIIKLGPRKSDGAKMAIIELVK